MEALQVIVLVCQLHYCPSASLNSCLMQENNCRKTLIECYSKSRPIYKDRLGDEADKWEGPLKDCIKGMDVTRGSTK